MISAILTNLWAFALSMPTNMIILVVVSLIMKVLGRSTKDCIKVILCYILAGMLLSLVGITMPNFLVIGTWIANLLKSVW